LSKALGTLLPRLERAARTASGDLRPEIHRLLARTYQALAAAFVRQDEADAAWLAAVAGIVRSQKGGITVESEAVRGSTFRVFLPASEGRAEAESKAAGFGGGATILVVDDEAAVRNFIGAVLRKRGYRVVSASDGREALAVLERPGELLPRNLMVAHRGDRLRPFAPVKVRIDAEKGERQENDEQDDLDELLVLVGEVKHVGRRDP
jgi:hypothetical protein